MKLACSECDFETDSIEEINEHFNAVEHDDDSDED